MKLLLATILFVALTGNLILTCGMAVIDSNLREPMPTLIIDFGPAEVLDTPMPRMVQ